MAPCQEDDPHWGRWQRRGQRFLPRVEVTAGTGELGHLRHLRPRAGPSALHLLTHRQTHTSHTIFLKCACACARMCVHVCVCAHACVCTCVGAHVSRHHSPLLLQPLGTAPQCPSQQSPAPRRIPEYFSDSPRPAHIPLSWDPSSEALPSSSTVPRVSPHAPGFFPFSLFSVFPIRSRRNSQSRIHETFFLFSFPFLGHTGSIWKCLGEGSDPSHSSHGSTETTLDPQLP